MEHRPLPGAARRSGNPWRSRFSAPKRSWVAHVWVKCDGRVAAQVGCGRRVLTGASDADGARQEVSRQEWTTVELDSGVVWDLCPEHGPQWAS